MPNPYIKEYEKQKILTNRLDSIIGALEQLKKDRKEWGFDKKRQGSKIGWRGNVPNPFFHVETTAKNDKIISVIVDKLKSLQGILNTQDVLKKENLDKIIEILEKDIHDLSPGGQTYELLNYILKDIRRINYTDRASSLLDYFKPKNITSLDEIPLDSLKDEKIKPAEILVKKDLPPNLFETKAKIQFNDSIAEHIKWIYNNLYKVPYPVQGNYGQFTHKVDKNIARYHHGIQHVTRVAMYVPIFANLYRMHGDEEAQHLTEDDIKLLQLAAVFHDSAREDEAEDEWDHESAIFLYMYLTKELNVEKSKAKLIAEAIANKDPTEKGYYCINETFNGEISWTREPQCPKNIFQKIIHDADSLDIIRARDNFEAEHLDFYKQHKSTLAIEQMAHLVTEARSLIEIQGDSRNRTKTEIKLQYEHENAYSASINSIDEKKHPIITKLGKKLLSSQELEKDKHKLIDLEQYNPNHGLTEKNLRAAIRNGRVFVRGIGTPSALSKKSLKSGEDESLAHLELRKTLRRRGTATTTTKGNPLDKEGNPLRSVSMIGYGSGTFTNAGFLIVDPNINDISDVHAVDSGSGRGKKSYIASVQKPMSIEEKRQKLLNLQEKLKMGGETIKFDAKGYASNHVEILYHIKDYSAIYFSNDPNLYNDDMHGSPEVTHRFSPLLQAIYLRNEYQKTHPSKKELPIIEYSGLHNTVRIVPPQELTPENIKKMWVQMCSDYIKSCLSNVHEKKIYDMSIDDIKTLSMYKFLDNKYARENKPADANYNKEFQAEISEAIKLERERLIKEHEEELSKQIQSEGLSVFDDKVFFNLMQGK